MTAADLLFDAESHTTTTPDGRDVPHVTTVLSAVGVSVDFAELAGVSAYAGENIATARLRGRAVHEDCHAYDDGDLLIETVHRGVRPFLDAWVKFRDEKRVEPILHARERYLFHPTFFYVGTTDGVFLDRRTKRILLDLKTGDPDDAACHIQTAAYQAAWEVQYPDALIDERWGVHLTPKTRVPYRVVNYSARRDAHLDLGKWLACLCVYNEQHSRRTRIQ